MPEHGFDTIDDLPADQRLLVRLDLNSPIEGGIPKDNRRFERHAETVRELAAAGHRVVLLAHQGRPGRDDFVSLEDHAGVLADHVGKEISFVGDTHGEAATEAIEALEPGGILLLENSRMCGDELPEESPEAKADTEFVRTLAAHVDAYVNDAYSAAHRSHASLVGFPERLPSYAGRVMEAEYAANTAIANRTFDGRVTMVVGGTKATDVIEVMDALGDSVDDFLLGGIAGELFLRAAGHPVGFDLDPDQDLYDSQWERNHDLIERVLAERAGAITLASDLAYAAGTGDDGRDGVDGHDDRDGGDGQDDRDDDGTGERAEVAVDDIDEKSVSFLDIGTDTAEGYADVVRDSEAVFVKGALGVFEEPPFSVGTVTVLEAIAETDCFSVVGGGDTSRAIERYGLDEDDFDHVSIAGGAYIRALTGKPLAGVEALKRAAGR